MAPRTRPQLVGWGQYRSRGGVGQLKARAGLVDAVAMGIENRDYMRHPDDAPERPELRPDIPWHSASRMSDNAYKSWLFQNVDRPLSIIVVTVLLGIVGLYLVGDNTMRQFVNSVVGQ